MASEKFMLLLENLVEATSEGRVQWKETGTEGQFAVDLDSVVVEVAREDSDDDDDPYYQYVVTLKAYGGKVLELEIFTHLLGADGRSQCDTAQKLFELARQSALKIDQIIDSVINNLKLKKT